MPLPVSLEPPRYKLRVVHPAGVVYAEAWEFDEQIRRDLEGIRDRVNVAISSSARCAGLMRADFSPESEDYGKWFPIVDDPAPLE